MNEKLFAKLMEIASAADKAKLAILHNAMVSTANAYKNKSTSANLKDWQGAEEALTRAVEDISMKCDKGGDCNGSQIDLQGPWKTKAGALLYLQAAGWAIEKQTFYNHTNPSHRDFKLNKEKGFYTKSRVDKYAKEWLIRADTGLPVDEKNTELLRQKTEKEIAKLDLDLEIKQHGFDITLGKYLPRDQLYLEIVGRAGILDSGFNFMLQAHALEMVTLVGGDQRKVPEFVAALRQKWNTLLGNFARLDNIEVAFTED